jgi:hypothetical protein
MCHTSKRDDAKKFRAPNPDRSGERRNLPKRASRKPSLRQIPNPSAFAGSHFRAARQLSDHFRIDVKAFGTSEILSETCLQSFGGNPVSKIASRLLPESAAGSSARFGFSVAICLARAKFLRIFRRRFIGHRF